MIEVPMRVDQMPDRIAAERIGSLQDARTRRGDARIDEYLPIRSCQDSDIAAGALENAYVATKFVDGNRRFGGTVADQVHDVASLRVRFPRIKPALGCCHSGGGYAAKAEFAARDCVPMGCGHELSRSEELRCCGGRRKSLPRTNSLWFRLQPAVAPHSEKMLPS